MERPCQILFIYIIYLCLSYQAIAQIAHGDNPYPISDCNDLQNIRLNLNANYDLIQDIDCLGTKKWNNGSGFLPIGNSDVNSFNGTLNGYNHIVSGLYINTTASYVGLFGVVFYSGKIINVSLKNVYVKGYSFVGGLVGRNIGGTIINTCVTGDILNIVVGGGGVIGGLVGQNTGTISHSYSAGQVITNSNGAGGLVGLNYNIVKNSYSMATVYMYSQFNMSGGLIGSNFGTVLDSYSTGSVNKTNGGGLIGYSGPAAKTLYSYWNVETSGKSISAGGIGKTSAEMKLRATYEKWDFYKTWRMNEIAGYPSFRTHPFKLIFSLIMSPQKVETPFVITVTADDIDFKGTVYLYSGRGKISPTFISMQGKVWTGEVKLYSVGKDNHLEMRWYNSIDDCSGSSGSNIFDVVNKDGNIPNDATLTGIITDDDQNPIANVLVQMYSENPKYNKGLLINSTFTDSKGNYQFKGVSPETIYLNIQKSGFQKKTVTIGTVANLEVTGNIVLYSGCLSKKGSNGLVPVLLIPGMMGSKSSGLIYPSLPVITPAWNSGKLKLHDGLLPWWTVGWEKIKKKFKKVGYKNGCNLFEVAYDWTLSIESIRDQFLIPWINYAKSKSGEDKVDIVAHSMGGLVARSYIQSTLYSNDVRKLALVGTPNKGANVLYYIWEGGDPITADLLLGNDFLYMYTNTLYYLYKDRTSLEVCSFSNPLKNIPESCNNVAIYNFLHKTVHSIGQLMPIYDNALLDYKTCAPVLIEKEQNNFLRALNNLPCGNSSYCFNTCGQEYSFNPPENVLSSDSSKVETKLFLSNKDVTIASTFIKSQPLGYNGEMYKDGIPQNKPIYDRGDGAVLETSVVFNDYFPPGKGLPVNTRSGAHSQLIKKFKRPIVKFITGKNVDFNHVFKPPRSILVISIVGRVQPSLLVFNNETNYQKECDLEYCQLEIINPLDGAYKIKLNSPKYENYEVSIGYINVEIDFTLFTSFWGYYDSTLRSFTLAIDKMAATNSTIKFDRTFSTPTHLQICNGSSGHVQLLWEDKTGDVDYDVLSYLIYWRHNDEPYLQFLAQTSEKLYETNHTWTDAIKNTYVVKSLLETGSSTFFSRPTWINNS